MKIDFLILYEDAQRELENACLLKCELKRRGYSVIVDYMHTLTNYFYKPKVLIVPHLYDDSQVFAYCLRNSRKIKKIIQLQYEQILSNSNESKILHMPSEQAIMACHIAWGRSEYNRYINSGINSERIRQTGCISMDLNHKNFDSCFFSKEELGKIYNINPKKPWFLFLANFTLCDWSDEKIDSFKDLATRFKELKSIMISSKNIIIEWIKKTLIAFPNIEIIYRPHPVENVDDNMLCISSEHSNFHINRNYSVRQWIRVSDKISTWNSTSIIDCFYAKKDCSILRPEILSDKYDAEILVDAKTIDNYDDFKKFISSKKSIDYPIKIDKLVYYYGEWNDGCAFIRLADVCEEVIKSDFFIFNFSLKKQPFKIVFSYFINSFVNSISKYFKISNILKIIVNNEKYIQLKTREERQLYKKNKEKRGYCSRFNKLLSK